MFEGAQVLGSFPVFSCRNKMERLKRSFYEPSEEQTCFASLCSHLVPPVVGAGAAVDHFSFVLVGVDLLAQVTEVSHHRPNKLHPCRRSSNGELMLAGRFQLLLMLRLPIGLFGAWGSVAPPAGSRCCCSPSVPVVSVANMSVTGWSLWVALFPAESSTAGLGCSWAWLAEGSRTKPGPDSVSADRFWLSRLVFFCHHQEVQVQAKSGFSKTCVSEAAARVCENLRRTCGGSPTSSNMASAEPWEVLLSDGVSSRWSRVTRSSSSS